MIEPEYKFYMITDFVGIEMKSIEHNLDAYLAAIKNKTLAKCGLIKTDISMLSIVNKNSGEEWPVIDILIDKIKNKIPINYDFVQEFCVSKTRSQIVSLIKGIEEHFDRNIDYSKEHKLYQELFQLWENEIKIHEDIFMERTKRFCKMHEITETSIGEIFRILLQRHLSNRNA